MIYIIYKQKEEKEKIKKIISNINTILYNSNNITLEKFNSKVSFINYSYFNNIDLINEINSDKDIVFTKGDNIFYKTYNFLDNDATIEKELLNLYTHVIACSDNEIRNIALMGDDNTYLTLFYSGVESVFYNMMTGNNDKNEVFEDTYNLGLLAFSNGENNDLINGYLYDREGLKNKYENIMGEGSFERLNYYSLSSMVTYADQGSLPNIEYLRLIEDLKKYFDITISNDQNISLEEKDLKSNEFNKLYFKIRHNFLEKKKKIN